MCGKNIDEACGWPKKTVRATIAMSVVIPVTIGAIIAMTILFVNKEYESALAILSSLTGLTGTIIGYYFGARSAESASDLIAKTEHELIESKNKEIEMLGRSYRSYQNNDQDEVINV